MGLLKPKRRKKGILEKAIGAGVKESQKAKRKAAAEAAKVPQRRMAKEPAGGEPFPHGVRGLYKVETRYKDGSPAITYAFQERDETLEKCLEGVSVVNELLDTASELSGHELGQITRCVFDVPALGWAFTRVDYEPVTRSGNPSPLPVKVRFESSEEPCSDKSYSGIISYDPEGEVKKVEVTYWVTPSFPVKMQASRVRGELKVKSVVLLGSSTDDGQVWYKA